MTRDDVEEILQELLPSQILEVSGLADDSEALVVALRDHIEENLDEIISSMADNGLIDSDEED